MNEFYLSCIMSRLGKDRLEIVLCQQGVHYFFCITIWILFKFNLLMKIRACQKCKLSIFIFSNIVLFSCMLFNFSKFIIKNAIKYFIQWSIGLYFSTLIKITKLYHMMMLIGRYFLLMLKDWSCYDHLQKTVQLILDCWVLSHFEGK